jgi:ABC-2 type transport system permease protein
MVQFAVYLNPMTYGVDALRYTILNSSVLPLYINLAVLVIFAAITVFASAYLFSKKEQGLM